jgi:uncharacterized protein
MQRRRISVLRTTRACFWSIVAALLLLMLLDSCHVGPRADGNYVIRFAWDRGLREVEVVRERTDRQLPAAIRNEVVGEAEPIIEEQLKKANLTRAEGELRLVLSGPPPYAVFPSGIQILRPSISELFAAVDLEDVDKIKALVSQHQNVNQRELPNQRTALFMAAAGRRIRSLQALLDLGADPNIPDFEGDTPLGTAAIAGDRTAVQLLINAGAQVDHANGVGLTPLMKAADIGQVGTLELLLRSGADPNLKASNGKTALTFAREAGHKGAIAILERPRPK